MNRKHLLMLIGAVILFSTATTFAGSQVTVLTNQQADEIVGAWFACNTCDVLSSGCADYANDCTHDLQKSCKTRCTSGLQNAKCRWMPYGPGCETLSPSNCGNNKDGLCENMECDPFEYELACGDVTNCRTPN